MTRGLTSGMQTAIAAQVVRPCYLVSCEFTSTTLYLCSLNKDISFSAQTWLGNGLLLNISGVEEQSNSRATGWQIELNGTDQAMVALALGSTNQSKTATCYLGLLDASENLIADPEQIAGGYFDSAEIEETGLDTRIVLNIENELLLQRRISELRYTKFSQIAIFAGDDGFNYTNVLEDWSGFWGKSGRMPRQQRKRRRGRN